MRQQGDKAPEQGGSTGTAESGDTIEMRERYVRLLSWMVRIALIGVAAWLVGTPLRSGAATFLN